MFPKPSAYVKSDDGQTKWVYFFIENHNLLEKYNTIWDNDSADIKKKFDSMLVYNKVSLKTKIKSHGDKEIAKVDSDNNCLTAINLDSALKKNENYYPQVFLKECKYIKKKVISHIIDDIESSSNDSYDSDEEQIKAMRIMYFYEC